MPARFDSIRRNLVDKVNNLMGYPGIWVYVNDDGQTVTNNATVLFKDPTHEKDFSGIVSYDPLSILMEFKVEDFVGLRERVNAAASDERVKVDGTDYYVRQVNQKYDGKTMIAILETIDTDDIELDTTLNAPIHGGD